MTKKKIVVSFSGGKDSTLALHELIHAKEFEIDSLLTTLTEDYRRTSIHGVREELLEAQARSIGIPLRKVWIPKQCSNEVYQQIMGEAMEKVREDGIEYVAFGDLFLEDVRKYREEMLTSAGFKAVFPLWGADTKEVMSRFLSLGYQTITTCIDLTRLSESFSGKLVDQDFLHQLPEDVDPCGENGEYHTFVFAGPIFNTPIPFTIGEKRVVPDLYTGELRFCFTDLVPVT